LAENQGQVDLDLGLERRRTKSGGGETNRPHGNPGVTDPTTYCSREYPPLPRHSRLVTAWAMLIPSFIGGKKWVGGSFDLVFFA
jgi:hypothetical protein